jgi:hypothetical protein
MALQSTDVGQKRTVGSTSERSRNHPSSPLCSSVSSVVNWVYETPGA